MRVGSVYPDNINATLSICYVNSECKEKGLRFSNNGVHITLATRVCEHISPFDFVIPPWACAALSVPTGQHCEYSPVSFAAALTNTRVQLVFVAFKCDWQWADMLPSLNSLYSPQSWRFDWPDGVNSDVLSSMLPSMLQGTLLTHDACIVVKVFDLLMMFRVELSCESYGDQALASFPTIEATSALTFSVVTSISKSSASIASNEPSLSSSSYDRYVCYPTVMNRLVDTFQQLSSSIEDCALRFLSKSHLLCGTEGSGKSYLMAQFVQQVQQKQQSRMLYVSSSCSVLTPSSCSTSLNDLNALLGSAVVSQNSSSVAEDGQLLAYLRVLMKALAVPDTLQVSIIECWSNGSNSTMLWLIDDLDQVFHQYAGLDSANDNEDSVTATIQLGNEFQIVGYLLHQVLKLLANRSDGSSCAVNLMVVGACRLDVRHIPRAHTGAPEFEKVLSLPRLSADSRQAVIASLLRSHLSLNSERICNDKSVRLALGDLPSSLLPNATATSAECGDHDDVVHSWSHRLAGLTAGYCPVDLVALLKQTLLLHRGKSGMLGDGEFNSPLEWETVMQAMLSLPPKQLQSLGIESSGSSSGSSGSSTNIRSQKLGWSDFGGYTDTINLLKRLLTPRNTTSIVGSSSTSVLSPGEEVIPGTGKDGSRVTDFGSRMSAVPKGIVLYGPTGCGKSLLARIIASEARMNFVSIRSTEILSKYFGQTESAIRTLFQKARSAAPCVLFFDEFDAIAYKRGADDEGGNGLHGRVLSTFLNELDGVTSANDRGFENSVMVLAACSDVDTLDEALIRPGRLQYHILLDKPTCEDVQCIIRNQIRSMPVDESVNVLHTATLLMTMHPSCADAEALCQKALFGAIREHIHSSYSGGSGGGDDGDGLGVENKKVKQSHFNQALSELTGMTLENIAGIRPREAVFQWSGGFNISF